jgi:hypothetical protein
VKNHPPSGSIAALPLLDVLSNQQVPQLCGHGTILALLSCHTQRNLDGEDRRWCSALNEEPYTAADRTLARAILRYLEVHPDAKDTVEGIAQWWLLHEWHAPLLRVHVKRAVSCLLSQGLILEIRRPGVLPYYQRHSQQREAITKFLEGA